MKPIDHIAIAVNSLDDALPFYQNTLGLHLLGIEVVEEQGVRVAKLDTGNTHIELLEPLTPDSPVGKFIAQHGQGLHHICFKVKNISSELQNLKACDIRLINEEPKIGAGGAKIAFVHPKSSNGVLMELSESSH